MLTFVKKTCVCRRKNVLKGQLLKLRLENSVKSLWD